MIREEFDEPVAMDDLLRHRDFVRRSARRLTGDHAHDSDDLEQEVWLAALRTPPSKRGAVRAWISNVARYRAIRNVWGRRETAPDPEDAELHDRGPEPSELVQQRMVRRRVRDAIDGLPTHYGDILRMRYLDELSAAEIAGRSELPLETVKTRLQRGRVLLRQRIDERGSLRRAMGLGAALVGWGRRFGRRTVARRTAGVAAVAAPVVAVVVGLGSSRSAGESVAQETTARGEVVASTDDSGRPGSEAAQRSSARVELESFTLALVTGGAPVELEGRRGTLIDTTDSSSCPIELDARGRAEVPSPPGRAYRLELGNLVSTFETDARARVHVLDVPPLVPVSFGISTTDSGDVAKTLVEAWIEGEDEPRVVGVCGDDGRLDTCLVARPSFLVARSANGADWSTILTWSVDPESDVSLETRRVPTTLLEVVDSSGHPVQGARVASFGRDPMPLRWIEETRRQVRALHRWRPTTNDEGRIRIPVGVHATETVVAHANHAPTRVTLPDRSVESATVRVVLGAGRAVEGVVSTPSGRAGSGMTVRASIAGLPDRWAISTTTDADGSFRLERLPADVVELAAPALGVDSTVQVDLTARDRHDVTLEARPDPRRVRIARVVDLGGEPIAGATVELHGGAPTSGVIASDTDMEQYEPGPLARSDQDGRVLVVEAPPRENASLVVHLGDDRPPASGSYALPDDDGEIRLVVDPRRGAQVTLRVPDGAVETWSRRLLATRRTGRVSRSPSREEGSNTLTFEGLHAGDWTLSFDAGHGHIDALMSFELAENECLDLGPIELPRLGVVLGPAPDGTPDARNRTGISLRAHRLGVVESTRVFETTAEVTTDGAAQARLDLLPGRYMLRISGGRATGLAAQVIEVVADGIVDLSPAPVGSKVPQLVRFVVPRGSASTGLTLVGRQAGRAPVRVEVPRMHEATFQEAFMVDPYLDLTVQLVDSNGAVLRQVDRRVADHGRLPDRIVVLDER